MPPFVLIGKRFLNTRLITDAEWQPATPSQPADTITIWFTSSEPESVGADEWSVSPRTLTFRGEEATTLLYALKDRSNTPS